MKKVELRQIIKEEIQKVLNVNSFKLSNFLRENEGENNISAWWDKADDELNLDFKEDIYSILNSYDEPWQGEFAKRVIKIKATNYEDFKTQVKKIYNRFSPF
jgi:hypothetical protein